MRLLIPLVCLAAAALAAPPNIVLIVSDDQGWNDVSFHGGEIRTPNIDRIAREGVQLDRFYVCPVCSPTRAGMLTGRYPIRFGMQRAVCRPFLDVGLPPEEITIPEMLAQAGYRARAAIGKWHVGHAFERFHPLNQGFTFFYGHYNGNIDYFTHERDGELDWHRNLLSSHDEGYSTDLIADEAVRFIQNRKGVGPFFLYVPFNAPHEPLQVPDKWLDGYANIADKDRRTYAAMVAAMDAGVGRILDTLDKSGLAANTLVWFTSDNGGARNGDNTPLRAGKGTLYEGGIRVAAAVRWPAGLEGGGRKVSGPLAYIDVWPTLARVAGFPPDPEPSPRPLDGVDVWDVIQGRAQPPKRPFFSYYERYQGERLAMIDYPWKLVRDGPPILGPNSEDAPPKGMKPLRQDPLTVELFQLDADPYEQNNLAEQQPKRVQDMLDALRHFRAQRPRGGVPPMTAPDPPGWKPPHEWEMRIQ
ncbi:MAG: sulfatase-like hydrolase/transferase [Acidobacteria bacterium]|nr:sulfatase-like hydrolase/transferase [Acidobacteriota bacterium]